MQTHPMILSSTQLLKSILMNIPTLCMLLKNLFFNCAPLSGYEPNMKFKCSSLSVLVMPIQILKAWRSKTGWEFETEHFIVSEGEGNSVIW